MPYEPAFPPESPGTPQRSRDSRSEFVYPYNFIPHGGPCQGGNLQQGVGADNRFKPLHRHDGLTGRIEYTLTTLGPLFIADSEGTTSYQKPKGIHRVMDFFNVDGRLCLPSTSLKGMVRSVVETASNSSLGVFTSVDEQYSYRKTGNFRRQVGKWTNNGTIKPWGMAKLPLGSLRNVLASILGRTPTDDDLFALQYRSVQVQLWKIHTGSPVVVAFNLNGSWHDGVTISTSSASGLSPRTFTLASVSSSNGRLLQRPGRNDKRMIRTTAGSPYYSPWDRDVYEERGLNCGRNRAGVDVQFKHVTFSGLNSGNNRVIEIIAAGNRWSAINTGTHDGEFLFHKEFLDPNVQRSDRYVRIIYRNADPEIAVNQDDVLEAFRVANERPPKVGETVYYEQTNNVVTEFGPVAMFKSTESDALEDLMSRVRQYAYPSSADFLCPATRLFGWTPESEQGEQGVAGRVRFGVAWSDKHLQDTRLIPLKVLGSPRPKYYPFYLRPTPQNGRDPSTKAAYYAEATEHPWAQTPGTLRGRKFYLHHPGALSADREQTLQYIRRRADELEPQTVQEDPNWEHSHQNATCAVLPAPAAFKGIIEFDSLDKHELGLLLWCLTLSENPLQESQDHAHKLGMGKGIGLGSVRFHLERVIIEQPERRWFDLEGNGVDLEALPEQELNQAVLSQLVRKFKVWMVTRHGEDDPQEAARYDALPFVRDLKLLMDVSLVPNEVPVQYYPPYWWSGKFPLPQNVQQGQQWYSDKGYTYFVNQRAQRARNQEEPLRTPSAIREGHRQGIL